jgi:hypothetical protein
MRLHRHDLIRAALIAAVPASAFAAAFLPAVHVLANADQSTALLLSATMVALVGLAAAIGPSALRGASRVRAAATVLVAGATLWACGLVWLIVAVVNLCSASAGPGLSALGVAAAVYVPGSVLALRDMRRTAWAWPIVIALAVGASLATLALATGGPHHCET